MSPSEKLEALLKKGMSEEEALEAMLAQASKGGLAPWGKSGVHYRPSRGGPDKLATIHEGLLNALRWRISGNPIHNKMHAKLTIWPPHPQ